jgi:hypothetical protein
MREQSQNDQVPATSRDGQKRQLIRNEAGEENYLDFQIRCIRKFGPAAGLFLQQHIYWIGKEHDKEGWVYKTEAEMEKETGLSRRYQREARKILRSKGVLKEKKQGVPCRLWYWVDLEALSHIMKSPHSTMNQWKRYQDNCEPKKASDEGEESSRDSNAEHTGEANTTVQASKDDNTVLTSKEDITEPTSEDRTNVPAITESTPKTTTGTLTLASGPSSGSLDSEEVDPQTSEEGSTNRRQVEECVRILADIEGLNGDKRALSKFVNSMMRQFPQVDAVSVCERFRERVDSSIEPIRSHQALLTTFFEKAAEDGKKRSESPMEPLNPHSPEGEKAKEKPYNFRWYATFYAWPGLTEEDYERVVAEGKAEGKTHSDIVEDLNRRRQTRVA